MKTNTPIDVLLVEDNPGDARLTREMLTDAGGGQFRVVHTETLAAAIARLQDTAATNIDVVLLDLSLPDSQGLEGVVRLQAVNPHLPIIVLSGLDDDVLSFEAVQVGAQDYLVKGRGEGEVMVRVLRYAIERKRVHMQLLEEKERAELANRSKSEFLANMSHELRTPLNAIIGFSEILENELMGPLGAECYKEYAGNIRESGAHLLDIINDILDLSKIEAGKDLLLDEIIDLSRTIRSCLRLIGMRAEIAKVTLIDQVSPTLPPMQADERKMKQILINLLSNAVKFTPEGGTVTLSAARVESGGIEIVVSDTGTGLGLPLAENFTRMHGGTLVLESRVGEGTRVVLNFPASRVAARAAAS